MQLDCYITLLYDHDNRYHFTTLVLVYKSFCNTVCIYMVMQIKLVVVVVVAVLRLRIVLARSIVVNLGEKILPTYIQTSHWVSKY